MQTLLNGVALRAVDGRAYYINLNDGLQLFNKSISKLKCLDQSAQFRGLTKPNENDALYENAGDCRGRLITNRRERWMCSITEMACWEIVHDNFHPTRPLDTHKRTEARDADQHILSDDGVTSCDVGATPSIILLLGYVSGRSVPPNNGLRYFERGFRS